MASTTKSAVSDYEHLKFRLAGKSKNQVNFNDSEEDDFLPLKEIKQKLTKTKNYSRVSNLNSNHNNNNNNPSSSSFNSNVHDNNNFGVHDHESISRVPVASIWSPNMVAKPQPSIFITPERPSKNSFTSLYANAKDDILEPQDLNKVPAPMVLGLDPLRSQPSVFITPEKSCEENLRQSQQSSALHKSKPNIQQQTGTVTAKSTTTTTKDKLTVRFDLPSNSSSDELISSEDTYFSEFENSPVTIYAKDINNDENERRERSERVARASSKVYDPYAYSDESVLDDSIPGNENGGKSKSLNAFDKVKDGIDINTNNTSCSNISLSTSANLVEKLNQLLVSSNPNDCDFEDENEFFKSAASSRSTLTSSQKEGSPSLNLNHESKSLPSTSTGKSTKNKPISSSSSFSSSNTKQRSSSSSMMRQINGTGTSKSNSNDKSKRVDKSFDNNHSSSSTLPSKNPKSIIKKQSQHSNTNNNNIINKGSHSLKDKVKIKDSSQSQFLDSSSSASQSQYYPPSSGSCVVREAKPATAVLSTDYSYSYPFQGQRQEKYNSQSPQQEEEHVFSRPEFNSTLKVRKEIDVLCDQEVDLQRAVEVKLMAESNSKRTEIHEKAAVYTNRSRDQFSNLVDVEPSIDHLCDRVVRMRASKNLSRKKDKQKKKAVSRSREPDLMEFYSSDLHKEAPDFTLLGINLESPTLMGAPHDSAFDCYRHHRSWNGLQDF